MDFKNFPDFTKLSTDWPQTGWGQPWTPIHNSRSDASNSLDQAREAAIADAQCKARDDKGRFAPGKPQPRPRWRGGLRT
jgi:hypothetical protein